MAARIPRRFCVLAIFAACSSPPASHDAGSPFTCPLGTAVASRTVTVRDFSFSPACIVVRVGTTVTWTNAGMPTNSVTSDPGAPVSFDSGSLGFHGAFSFTFTTPGVINYRSMPFQVLGMQGAVIVQ